ncbi:MAG: TatD family hydrolase [Methanomicrobium sp.]|nr:TatD family hydrolase [Methanomicrobium sp.]MBQ4415829.1 TatD family hydrolase [Methanomicrobium sp.]
MILDEIPITDDHIHIDTINGLGVKAATDFRNAGGTHMFAVSLPSWTFGIVPHSAEDFRKVFENTLDAAESIRGTGLTVFAVLGVHPAEITKIAAQTSMTLPEIEEIMKGGMDIAAKYVTEGDAVALKSGRPHYPVDEEVRAASNRILIHSLELAKDCGCALQIHAETGPCADVADMARSAGMDPCRVVKHFAENDTPLSPSFIAKYDGIAEFAAKFARENRYFTMESDYMDDPTRPGSVIGPKSVPRFTRRLLEKGAITLEDAVRIHKIAPEKIYSVDIEL